MINANLMKQRFELVLTMLPQLTDTISEIAERIWQSGWAEANAGNMSFDISSELRSLHLVKDNDETRHYLVSRTGSRYRQYGKNLADSFVLVGVEKNDSQSHESIYPKGAKPTSEWLTHRRIQEYFQHYKPDYKCIIHVHPAEIIALSQLPVYDDPVSLNQRLMSILPETKYYLPTGVAMARFAETGTRDLADATLAALEGQNALIWQGHGLMAFGKNPNEAFDYLEIVNKAAKLWFMLK
ncbi:MAG: class II aldolase/adducin family protein [Candidatus Cloacimonadota bacterium]